MCNKRGQKGRGKDLRRSAENQGGGRHFQAEVYESQVSGWGLVPPNRSGAEKFIKNLLTNKYNYAIMIIVTR